MSSEAPVTPNQFESHLSTNHGWVRFSPYLGEIVYGGTDGIVTTFAIVAGFAGAGSSAAGPLPITIVLLFGVANLLADGVSMGLGNFLSLRSEREEYEHQQRAEYNDVAHELDYEIKETEFLLMQEGFDDLQAEELTKIISTNKPFWIRFMLDKELGMADVGDTNPSVYALYTFFAFLLFGSIPLLPYLFMPETDHLFWLSLSSSLVALMLLGTLRWKLSQGKLIRDIGEVVFIGSVAASVAFFVGSLF